LPGLEITSGQKQKSRSSRAAAVFIHRYRNILCHTLAPPAELRTTEHTHTESGRGDVHRSRRRKHGFFSFRNHSAAFIHRETNFVNRIVLMD